MTQPTAAWFARRQTGSKIEMSVDVSKEDSPDSIEKGKGGDEKGTNSQSGSSNGVFTVKVLPMEEVRDLDNDTPYDMLETITKAGSNKWATPDSPSGHAYFNNAYNPRGDEEISLTKM